jgi:hypothetical protein
VKALALVTVIVTPEVVLLYCEYVPDPAVALTHMVCPVVYPWLAKVTVTVVPEREAETPVCPPYDPVHVRPVVVTMLFKKF